MGDDDLPPSLPDHVVQDDVLRRLPPVALAVCRCVCKAWRDVIDSRRMLLRSNLQPLGIFLNVEDEPEPPLLFAPPSMGRKVAANLESFVEVDQSNVFPPQLWIDDCCNGLLLLDPGHVVNPATRHCAALPPCPAADEDDYHVYHLLFDPAVSPHYQVLVLRQLYHLYVFPSRLELEDGSAEWPPSTYVMWVYSSETRSWEETPFVREGGPAGTLAEVRPPSVKDDLVPKYHRAVYYNGALYAKCKGGFIMRVTISNCKYQVIKLPEDVCESSHQYLHLLKSKNGVCAAIIHRTHLRVWLLITEDSSGRADWKWMFKYNINLQAVDAQFTINREHPIDRPWIIHDDETCRNRSAEAEDEFEWDFDKNNILEIQAKDEKYHPGLITILGFHPYTEVAFLDLSDRRVVAYHLDGSKVQDLGPLKNPYLGNYVVPNEYFVYTPCWMGVV